MDELVGLQVRQPGPFEFEAPRTIPADICITIPDQQIPDSQEDNLNYDTDPEESSQTATACQQETSAADVGTSAADVVSTRRGQEADGPAHLQQRTPGTSPDSEFGEQLPQSWQAPMTKQPLGRDTVLRQALESTRCMHGSQPATHLSAPVQSPPTSASAISPISPLFNQASAAGESIVDSDSGSHASSSESCTSSPVSRAASQEVVGLHQAGEGSTEDTAQHCDGAGPSSWNRQGHPARECPAIAVNAVAQEQMNASTLAAQEQPSATLSVALADLGAPRGAIDSTAPGPNGSSSGSCSGRVSNSAEIPPRHPPGNVPWASTTAWLQQKQRVLQGAAKTWQDPSKQQAVSGRGEKLREAVWHLSKTEQGIGLLAEHLQGSFLLEDPRVLNLLARS